MRATTSLTAWRERSSGCDDLAHEVHRERFVGGRRSRPPMRELAGDRAADEIVQRAVDDVAEGALGVRERGARRRRDAEVAQDREVEARRRARDR